MKVYSPAAGQTVLLKLEDKASSGAIAKEASTVTKVAEEWEELSFDFAPSDDDKYDLGVLFFNFQGSKASATTHYFDDIIVVESAGPKVKLPVDFESDELTYNWLGFDGGAATVIDNPETAGNSSAKVTELVKGPGQTWAGAALTLGEPIDFNNGEIFTINFWSASLKPVLLKFEGSSANDELTVNHSGSSSWETLTFDFTGKTDALGEVVKIVIIVDNGVAGDGTAASTYYLDDIQHKPVELPIDFEETGLNYNWLGFDGGAAMVIDNPKPTGNSSAKVTELVKGPGQTWAGVLLTIDKPIDFSSGEIITMNFWSASAKPVLLKFEGSSANDELTANHSGSSSWETLTFDFTGKTDALGDVVKLVIIVDNGVAGDGSAASTYYLDDIEQN